MALYNKNIISFILILVMSVVTGFSIGKIYVDNLEAVTEVTATEEELREKESDVLAWVNEANGGKKSATSFSAVQLYNIAEYKLYHADSYYKLMTGIVNAPMGIKQQMRSEKLHRDCKLVFNKLSPSTSSLSPSVCSQMIYDYSTQTAKINPKGSFDSNSEEIKGIFKLDNYKDYTLSEYKEIFYTEPTKVLAYIISSITCGQKQTSPVTDNGDGTYSFSIAIDGDYLALAGLYYAYEIKFSSGMKYPPKWVELKMDVTIDSSFNFVSIDYVESYKMNVEGIGMMLVTDVFYDTFEFENIPELSEVSEVF